MVRESQGNLCCWYALILFYHPSLLAIALGRFSRLHRFGVEIYCFLNGLNLLSCPFEVRVILKVYSKSIETEVVFTKTEMNNEILIFFKIVPLAFNTLISVSPPIGTRCQGRVITEPQIIVTKYTQYCLLQ